MLAKRSRLELLKSVAVSVGKEGFVGFFPVVSSQALTSKDVLV